MAKRQFKAESKRLLELMINSIYTNKEVFLRELISNASDALDKLYFRSIEEGATGVSRDNMEIRLSVDKEKRTLTIADNGIGMTKDELIENLGTIAKSGTFDFRKSHQDENTEIIGQFGVGFYSAFMVSDKITVKSRAFGSDEAWRWESSGEDGYTINPCEMEGCGTEITLSLRPDSEEEQYSMYLEPNAIVGLVKRYSDYIRYPIAMDIPQPRLKEGSETEYELVAEKMTLNSMVPLWRKPKDEVTDEDYNEFYKSKFMDFNDPLRVVNTSVEGMVQYNALLYIPGNLPYDYYTRGLRKGLQLYCNGVLIMENCEELLPDYFTFVKGIVDSPDFSLNISREILQHDRQLKVIAKNLEKKITSELTKMLADKREDYEQFFRTFGIQLKYGMYAEFGAHKETLKDLILFHSMADDKLITLKEYVEKMPEDQKYIYYACGDTLAKVKALPQADAVREKGYDVLCMIDDVDEFAMKTLGTYEGKELKSVSEQDLGLESQEEKDAMEKKIADNKELLEKLTALLDGKVKEVRLSSRLKKHPVCLVSDGDLSIDMEKILNAMPAEQKVRADRVLEINGEHALFAALTKISDDDKLKTYAGLLYDQALMIAGLPLEDPTAFSNAVCEIMAASV
ncbi:MAG: molecular chaperone HtpG [Clostridiales bacterium]|nr:molecular chaperone HtpG [Clostridiales bacterium]